MIDARLGKAALFAAAVALPGCDTNIGDPAGGDGGSRVDGGGGGGPADGGPPDAATRIDYEPSNIPQDLLTAGSADLRLEAEGESVRIRIDTDEGSIVTLPDQTSVLPVGVEFTVVDQEEGAPGLGVFSAIDVFIGPDARVAVTGENALVFAASGDVDLQGRIEATGGVGEPGPGGFAGGGAGGDRSGLGPGAGGGGSIDSDGSDSGGGGGGHGSAGGKGGDRLSDPGGAGGAVSGAEDLIPLVGGSGGGAGGGVGPVVAPGVGGGGGGAVQISARGTITVGDLGGINCGGGGAGGGAEDDAGGGGGGGGAILLEGKVIEHLGVLAANGGGGGAGAEGNAKADDGEAGRLGDAAAPGGAGGVEGEPGGAGGAAGALDGQPGTEAQANADDDSDNAGGGGGGVGRIHLRSRDGGARDGLASPPLGEASL